MKVMRRMMSNQARVERAQVVRWIVLAIILYATISALM